jgi:alpha/beta hydrolase family protein
MTMNARTVLLGSTALCLGVAAAATAEAKVTKLEVTRVESPTFEGRSFGAVGQYEKIVAKAYGEVDPNDPRNAVIVDIKNAPRNARGLVEYNTDVTIIKPVNEANGNHRLWFEVNNRGNIPAYQSMTEARLDGNDPGAKASDAGNGFLMNQGYTLVEAGWDISAPPGGGRFTIRVPVAKNPDGSPIVGPSMEEFVVDNATTKRGRLTYPAATVDKSKATLTVRSTYAAEPVVVPADQWQFQDEKGMAIVLTDTSAFKRGSLYTFVYQAKDPLVGGLGFAALRDLGSFLRYADKDEAGTANPVAGAIQYVYTACQSQPCRTLHDYVWLGFNEDESGKKVVDGISNWIGGSTGIFTNYRFGQGGRTQRQHIARWFPEFQGPFTNQVRFDPITNKTDGRLARCTASNTCPKVFETNSANEYWSKDMAVGLVDTKGKDLTDQPANVRNYFLSSMFHGGAFAPKGKGICQQVRSPLTPNAILRALIVDMDEWVSKGTEPPASRVPSADKGTLVSPLPQETQGFPKLQGVVYNGRMHDGDLFDFGPDFEKGIMTILPPKHVGTPYPALVPKTDADGNDIAGVRMPDVAVPVATYTGWALRAQPADGNDGCDGAGQFIPFAKTKAEREMNNDPRLSLEERYSSHEDYVAKVKAAAEALKADRLLLDADVQAYVAKADASPIGK